MERGPAIVTRLVKMLALHALGLVVFACGEVNGKVPSVCRWHLRKSTETIAKWVQRFADANIGVACGPSRVVIVDVDEPDLVEQMLQRFGDTPLITRTPSGGAHLWYGKVGAIRSGNLKSEGLAVDIKADGGMVIVPPSLNRELGKEYVFARGSWDDVARLPAFRREALAAPSNDNHKASLAGSITEGERNDTLYYYLMLMAPKVDHYERILAVACNFNRQMFSPPLSAAEVEDTARQVWHYEATDQNWIGHPGCRVVLLGVIIDDLLSRPCGADALVLLTVLWRFHGARGEPFAICCEAMARDHVITAWKDPRRYTRARKVLEDLGLIELASPSRRDRQGRCTPAKFKLARPGAKNAPNITLPPLPAPRPHERGWNLRSY